MAKKKEKEEELAPGEEKDIVKDILKKYGKGIIAGGNEVISNKRQIISLSPALDLLLNGGIPEGSWLALSSKSGVGKTITALQLAANCQKPENGSRKVYYLDIEGRLEDKHLYGVKGLDISDTMFHRIRSTEDKILSGQDFLQIGEDILKNTKRSVLIIDSYSTLCHENELLGGIGTSTRGSGGYQLLAAFCRQMCQVVPVKKHIVIGIAQLMANPSGYGAALQEKGGNSIMYGADTWLRAKGMEFIDGPNGKPIGQKIRWQTVKTALNGAVVGAEAESYLTFGIGLDKLREMIQFAYDVGLIEVSGAWYYCNFLRNHLELTGFKEWNDDAIKATKFHGELKLYAALEANPKWQEVLEKDIKELLLGK